MPQGSRGSRGKRIVNLFPLEDDRRINAILPVKEFDERAIFMATANGIVKVSAHRFSRPMKRGIIAVNLDGADYLIGVAITDGQHDVMLFSIVARRCALMRTTCGTGRVARCHRHETRTGQQVISLLVARMKQTIHATENGYGGVLSADHTRHARGTQGMIAIQTSNVTARWSRQRW